VSEESIARQEAGVRQTGKNEAAGISLISLEPVLVANSLCPGAGEGHDAQASGPNRKFVIKVGEEPAVAASIPSAGFGRSSPCVVSAKRAQREIMARLAAVCQRRQEP
jgi:hypothetical protein